MSMNSPGFYFNTPSNNPFTYFQSPRTPSALDNNLVSLRGMENHTIDEFQMQIQKEIESNMRG